MTRSDHLDLTLRRLTGYRLRRTTAVALAKMNGVFASFGLRRTTFATLSIVVDHPGLRQTQIAAALAIERANFVVIVDDLETAGLITRMPAVDDRRANAIEATDAGRDLLERSMQAVREVEQDLLDGLSVEQIATLQTALEAIEVNAKRLDDPTQK